MTGDECPADAPVRPGTFHQIEKADTSGHFVLHGLVPGRYMLGSDGWPANYAPRCVSNVRIRHDRSFDLPLAVGGNVSGRLVYARTGTPVITTLSYELSYPEGSPAQPTDEHPSRARTRGREWAIHHRRARCRHRHRQALSRSRSGADQRRGVPGHLPLPGWDAVLPHQQATDHRRSPRGRSQPREDSAASAPMRAGDLVAQPVQAGSPWPRGACWPPGESGCRADDGS